MVTQLKAMVVVMFFATAVFMVAKTVCLRFMSEKDFTRRRNVFLALTLTAFLAPSFWLYALVAVPLLAWAALRDSNPPAIYMLMLHVIPPFSIQLPVVGVNQLFDLNQYRILAFAVLLPMLLSTRGAASATVAARGWSLPDVLLVAYLLLQLALPIPYESVTNTLRRTFLAGLDVMLLYCVFSRMLTSRRNFTDMMAAFTLSCVVAAPIAAFESVKGWLQYQSIGDLWGAPLDFAFLMRGDTLRAQVSSGHSLALGYLMSMAFGFWLYLQSHLPAARWRWGVTACLLIGLIASYARGPWLVAIVVFLAFMAYRSGPMAKLYKLACYLLIAGGLLLVSPLGTNIITSLPFGNIDTGNVTYRQRLTEVSWQLVMQNPLFGDLFVMDQMESLRQGQGIIDLVNTYAGVALFYGLTGLALFLGFFLSALLKAHRVVHSVASGDRELAHLGAAIVACLVGTLFMMATGSFGTGLAQLAWTLGAMAVGYSRLAVMPTVATLPNVERYRSVRRPFQAKQG